MIHELNIQTHVLETEYQTGEQEIRVLLPDTYDEKQTYRVLYVLPVVEGFGSKFGDALAVLGTELDAHNQSDLIIVQMGFEKSPWYGDHSTDSTTRQESYLCSFVVAFIDQHYSTQSTAEGRLLLGFSKSGWGAFSLIFRNPNLFGYAAAWDSPHMLTGFEYNMLEVFGDQGTLDQYRPDLLAAKAAPKFQTRKRLVLSGESRWGTLKPAQNGQSHTVEYHELLASLRIQHEFNNDLNAAHDWNRHWISVTLDALLKLTE